VASAPCIINKIMIEKIKNLESEIQKAQNIALFSHIRMDPDTFGSATAFYYILEKM
jgi:nanoRNase/pAp phosphatase (c-di-AMP/oligoRNAs hydrolase)